MRPSTAGTMGSAHALTPAPTLATNPPGVQDRPATATSVRSATSLLKQKREQQMLVAMLHSTIADTYKRPPDGVSEADIVKHRRELEAMLEAVTQERHSTNSEAARLQAERWEEAYRAQLAKEEHIQLTRSQKEKRSQSQMEENLRELRERHEAQRKYRDDHTVGAFRHLDAVFKQRMHDLNDALDDKRRKQENLLSARSEWQRQQHEKQLAAERHAESLLERRRRLEEQRQKQLEAAASAHRAAAEEKAARSKALLHEKLRARKLHESRTHEKGQVDYEALRREEQLAQERRDRNVQEAIEMRNAHRKAVEDKFAMLREKQMQNRDQIVAVRRNKQDELLAFERARFSDIDAAVAEQAKQLERAGREYDKKIIEHQQRSRDVYTAKLNTMSTKIFNRWQNKASVIAQHIASTGVTPRRVVEVPASATTPQLPPSPSSKLSRMGSMLRPVASSARLMDA